MNDYCANLNENIRQMNEDIDVLKDKSVSQDTSILNEYEESLNNINQKIQRIREDADCKEWLKLYTEVDNLGKQRDEKIMNWRHHRKNI